MIAAIISLVLLVAGIALIAIGVGLSLADRKRAIEKESKVETEGVAGETLEGLAKLAEALKEYPLGMQLTFIGVALLALAAATGGAGALAAAV